MHDAVWSAQSDAPGSSVEVGAGQRSGCGRVWGWDAGGGVEELEQAGDGAAASRRSHSGGRARGAGGDEGVVVGGQA